MMLQNSYSLRVITASVKDVNVSLEREFLKIIHHIYSCKIFKNILDIVATKCSLNQLTFRLQNAKFFDIDAGNCITMVDDLGYADSSQKRKKYIITIKKLASDVIMHEIGHMLEHELSHILNMQRFSSMLMYEVNNAPIHMKSIVKSLFVDQLKGYPESQHISELFARFFQFFAGANEVAYQTSLNAQYRLQEAILIFQNTLAFLDSELANKWSYLVDEKISSDSQKFQNNHMPQEVWADRKVKTFSTGTSTSDRWKVKSNKADPFK